MMRALKNILYPTDFSRCAEKAFPHALVLAKAFGSTLHLFHAVVMYQEGMYAPGASETLEKLYDALEKKAHENFPVIEEDISIRKVVARGVSAAEEILGYANEKDIDLIVMGTHGRSELAHLLVGSVADRVLRNARCSVLAVRANAKDLDPEQPYARVVLATDFSEHSKHAAKWVKAISDRFGSEVHFVHVVEEAIHPAYFVTGKTSIFDFIPDIRERSTRTMEKIAEEVGIDPGRVRTVVLEGAPSAEISDYCKEIDADLVCVGSRGLKGLDYILLGSTAERLLRRAPCAVLSVKVPEPSQRT